MAATSLDTAVEQFIDNWKSSSQPRPAASGNRSASKASPGLEGSAFNSRGQSNGFGQLDWLPAEFSPRKAPVQQAVHPANSKRPANRYPALQVTSSLQRRSLGVLFNAMRENRSKWK